MPTKRADEPRALRPATLREMQRLAGISNKENRPMVLVTPGPHSEHYGFAEEINADFVRFRTLRGGTVVVQWTPETYIDLCPERITGS